MILRYYGADSLALLLVVIRLLMHLVQMIIIGIVDSLMLHINLILQEVLHQIRKELYLELLKQVVILVHIFHIVQLHIRVIRILHLHLY